MNCCDVRCSEQFSPFATVMFKWNLTISSLALLSLLLGNCKKGTWGFSTRNSKALPLEESTKAITLSIWLVPPTPHFHVIQDQIEEFSQFGKVGPVFPPHITVIGAIVCHSEARVVEVANILENGLAGFGRIPCSMSSLLSSRNAWNQALYLTVDSSPELLNLCQRARALLGMETDNWTFPAPAKVPHLSLFYGVGNFPDKSKLALLIPPFHAYTIALWCTDPATLEGVTRWRELRRFDIH